MSEDVRETNRAHWDALAAVHGQDAYYDAEALIGGADTLRGHEDAAVREAVGEVAGLDVLHLQCHIGFDSISLARRGARVTGADFSPASLEKGRDLAERAGVEVEFVEADATALPAELHGGFDLVYSTMGVICWIEDLGAWMRSVHSALRPGGKLVLVEIHPLHNMIGEREPLRVDALHEHLDTDFDPRGSVLTAEGGDRLGLRVSGERLPVLFTLLGDAGLDVVVQPHDARRR